MLDLNKVKYGLFDFDDTLCIHPNHATDNRAQYFMESLGSTKNMYKHCVKNKQMQDFINILKSRNVPMGLISWCGLAKRANAKVEWVQENYNVYMDNLSVGNRSDKLEIAKAYAALHNLNRGEILIVDDLYSTLEEFADAGFMACSPMEIVNFINDYSEEEEV